MRGAFARAMFEFSHLSLEILQTSPMRYFPAFFDLKQRPVFVIGGGELAVRKLRLVQPAAGRVYVFSAPKESSIYRDFGLALSVTQRGLSDADFDRDPALIIAASDDDDINLQAVHLAKTHKVPVNVVDQPEHCDVVIPSIVSRGDLSIGISTGGAAPVLGRRLRERIESLLPARLGELIAFAGERRRKVSTVVPFQARRRFWEGVFSGAVAEAVLDGDMDDAESGFEAALYVNHSPQGAIHIVGAGPGDPELLTLKALRVLQEADIVLYDNLVSADVLNLIRRDAERRYVGKKKGDHSMLQADIGALMVDLAKAGKRVVRLKGGDPFIFGRGGEEVDAIKAAGLTATVVPGITAAAGCAAATHIPLTHRGASQAVTFVTAQAGGGAAPDVNWSALAQLGQTIVVYMGVGKAYDVARSLILGGMPATMPAAVIEKGTLPDQKVIRTQLSELGAAISERGIEGPALLVIGEVAAKASAIELQNYIPETIVAA